MSVDVRERSQQPRAADAPTGFLARLDARVRLVGTSLCLGIDPDPASFPRSFSRDVAGVEAFSRLLIEAAAPHAAAVKVNLAFFEAFGSAGIAALERIRAQLPSGIPFIADAKRGDIGTTVARQAVAIFDTLDADAVTANPYLGREAIAPILERDDRFVYVLCRTSNPGAAEFQNLVLEGAPLYAHVARRVAAWSAGGDHVGLVVGATAPAEMAEIRAAASGLAFLVPGIGTQGGDLDAVLEHGPATSAPGVAIRGGALLVNVSRGISGHATEADDPGAAVAAAAHSWATQLGC